MSRQTHPAHHNTRPAMTFAPRMSATPGGHTSCTHASSHETASTHATTHNGGPAPVASDSVQTSTHT